MMQQKDEAGGISYEVRGAVALLTFNRPDALNPQSRAFWQAWFDFVERANADPAVGAIVTTATGRAFCVGGDIHNEFLPRVEGDIPWQEDDPYLGGLGFFPGDWLTLVRESKPMLAAVNGLAIGGGATAILPFDIILVSPEAQFIFPFAQLGLTPELGCTHYLSARVGFGRASELLLTGRAVVAEEAVSMGLANRLVERAELCDAALELADSLARLPAEALERNKRLITENLLEQDHRAIWQRESDALRAGFQSPEHREALHAFLEKREPDFSKFK